MAVGSAFDAEIKSAIAESLLGTKGLYDQLFEKQVESQNRDEARVAGETCMTEYVKSGAFGSLLKLLSDVTDLRMEFDEQKEIDGVVLFGKPDLGFTKQGLKIRFDWKVNGYYSNSPISPFGGYQKLFHKGNVIASRTYEPYMVGGLEVHGEPSIERSKPDWGRQMCTYAWTSGIEVGEEMVVMIDQLAWQGDKSVKIARHACEISQSFQRSTFVDYKDLWVLVQDGTHIFRDLSFEESAKKCHQLNGQAAAFAGESDEDKWYRQMMGRGT